MTKYHKLVRENLPDGIVSDLRKKIASQELLPGDKLPNETLLAESYGVGRGTIREAVKALSLMRLLDRSTAGTYVAAGARIHASEEFLANMHDEDPGFSSLYEARILLEKKVVSLACERATDEDIATVHRVIEASEGAVSEIDRLEGDLDYHYALAESAHSPVLLHLYMVTTEAVARSYKTFLHLEADWGVENHKLIAEAIQAKESERAQNLAEASLLRAYERMQQLISP